MDYAAKIEKDADMGYVASFPDLPHVNAFGATRKECLAQAKEALDAAMESDLSLGNTFIQPTTVPDADRGLFAVELSPKVEIAYKIFEARRGMTKAKVAKAAGMTPQAYQRFETPKGSPSVDTLYRIAAALGKRLEVRLV